MPEMTPAAADKTASAAVADVHSAAASAAAHLHRTAAAAASHVSPAAADMHPARGMHSATGAAAATATTMRSDRKCRYEKARSNWSDQRRFAQHEEFLPVFGEKRHLEAGTHYARMSRQRPEVTNGSKTFVCGEVGTDGASPLVAGYGFPVIFTTRHLQWRGRTVT
jgi:hypothetical protein